MHQLTTFKCLFGIRQILNKKANIYEFGQYWKIFFVHRSYHSHHFSHFHIGLLIWIRSYDLSYSYSIMTWHIFMKFYFMMTNIMSINWTSQSKLPRVSGGEAAVGWKWLFGKQTLFIRRIWSRCFLLSNVYQIIWWPTANVVTLFEHRLP